MTYCCNYPTHNVRNDVNESAQSVDILIRHVNELRQVVNKQNNLLKELERRCNANETKAHSMFALYQHMVELLVYFTRKSEPHGK